MFGVATAILTLATVSFAKPQSLWNRHGYPLIPMPHYPGVRNVHTVIPYQYQPYSYYNAYPSPYAAIIPHQMPNAPVADVKEQHHSLAKPYVFLGHCKKLKETLPFFWALQDTNHDGKVTWYEWSSTIHSFNEHEDMFSDVPVYNKHAFDISDDNNDNVLFYQEYLNAFDALLDLQMFGATDKNRDLLIDQAEWNLASNSTTPSKIESTIFDINQDGFINFVEYRGLIEVIFTGDFCA